jgi:hypothetical protein
MSPVAKGLNKIDTIIHDWNEEDRQDAIDFALHPGNGTSTIAVYLHQRGIKVSVNTVHRWQKSLIAESEKINRIKQVMNDFRGLEPIEIMGFVAAAMAESLINFQDKIYSSDSIDFKDIQGLTSLAKEARSAASSLMAAQSSNSMKDLELGFGMNFADKLAAIFEDDETTLERIRIACKGILTEIEGQYQSQN